jgi:perosamine synthetase
MQAAIGISQMKKLPFILEKKKNIYDLYQEHLSGLSDGFQSVHIPEYCTPVHWFTSFLTNEKKAFIQYMTDNKIQTREFFLPLNMQPCYKLPNLIKSKTEVRITRRDNYEPSRHIFDRGISLPSSYSLTKKDQMYVINKIEDFISMRDLLCNGS